MPAYRVRLCKLCRRKRRISQTHTTADYRYLRCSQGHVWSEEIVRLEKINEIFKSIYLEPIMDSMSRGPGTILLEHLKQFR